MNKIKLINGWTKEKVMAQVMKYNNGDKASFKGSCVYLAKDGNRCAVGCFIPDGHEALASRLTAATLAEKYPDLKSLMPFEDDDLIMFQRAHDCSNFDDVHKSIDNFLTTKVE